MTIVRRSSPWGELVSLRSAMDRLFEDSFVRPRFGWITTGSGETSSLALDAQLGKDELTIQAALPGVSPEDVDITIENGTLTIAGETRAASRDETDQYLLQEIRRGAFSRSVALPEGLEPDRATASFEHGVLTLHIPRAEQVKPRTIRISTTTDGTARSIETGGSHTGAGERSTDAGTAPA
jgi:HSP20 family protein